MVLKQIELLNFRLHRNTFINFSDNLNFIVGGNGQGKTSILEAIYYLSTTKNLNLAPEKEAVSFGQESFDINGEFQDLTSNKASLNYDLIKNKKIYFLDGKQTSRSSEVIGKFPIVTLIQADHAITQGAPSERRRFVDSVISQASHAYLEILLEYNKTLKQRSFLLSQIKESRSNNLMNQLDAWTETLINRGTELVNHRISFINEFNQFVKEAYQHIIEDNEEPQIEYLPFEKEILENTEQNFREVLDSLREEEIRRGTNLAGPHRDDFVFFINGKELKKYGSQGQHKTFQIALRFGQFFFMKDKLGKTPIFLMDDVFGELDKYRAGKISRYLSEVGQAFITMTDLTNTEGLNLADGNILIRVSNGKTVRA